MVLDVSYRNDFPLNSSYPQEARGRHENFQEPDQGFRPDNASDLNRKDSFASVLAAETEKRTGNSGTSDTKNRAEENSSSRENPGTEKNSVKERKCGEAVTDEKSKNPDSGKSVKSGVLSEKAVKAEKMQGKQKTAEAKSAGISTDNRKAEDIAVPENDKKEADTAAVSEKKDKMPGKKVDESRAEQLFFGNSGFTPDSATDIAAAGSRSSSLVKEIVTGTEKKEGKTADNRKGRAVFSIIDLRSEKKGKKEALETSGVNEGSVKNSSLIQRGENETAPRQQNIFELREISPGQIPGQSGNQVAVQGEGSNASRSGLQLFHNQVLDNLRESGNTEIIRNASMVLRDGGSGEIKLLMKPESLGFVRIKLTLEDNNIVGRIIVDNNSVKEIFENNMENLIKSFRESGYSSAMLDVSVGGENRGNESRYSDSDRPLVMRTIESVEEQSITRSVAGDENRLVDMVV